MREQTNRVKTGNAFRYAILAITVILVIGLAYVASSYFSKPEYVPPEFDAAAQTGEPSPAENLAYDEISAENGLRFSLAGTMYQQDDGSLLIYLTNPAASQCIISCEVKNEAGDTLYKSGAIRPGEYVERLMPQMEIENIAMPITMLVYAFEPDTWYSMGEVRLTNILQPN